MEKQHRQPSEESKKLIQEFTQKTELEVAEKLRPEREKNLSSLIKDGWHAYKKDKQLAANILEDIKNLRKKLNRKENEISPDEENIITTLERWCGNPED